MVSSNLPAIYLAGLPRSGTTWFGWVFAAAAHTTLVDEPFNHEFHPEATPYNLAYLTANTKNPNFTRILCRAAKEDFRSNLTSILPYRIRSKLPGQIRNPGDQVVIKDVHALLALEKIWADIHPKILLIIRHPCAVASSWHRLASKGNFVPQIERLLAQQKLIDEHLSEFVDHIKSENEFFFSVGAYWGAVNYVATRTVAAHNNDGWIQVTHEHLCADPLTHYETIFNAIGLVMTPRAKEFISKQDSRHEAEKWKSKLSQKQVRAVLAGSEPFGLVEKLYPA